ncbi:MAG: hypothetical protein K5785_01015 [Nitrosarchaeum sp.]|nr:hypothetical protein [Nitrosarchaeum sp.]
MSQNLKATAEIELRGDKFTRPAKEAKDAISNLGVQGRQAMQNLETGSNQAATSVKKTAAEINAARTATLGMAGSVAGLAASFVGLETSISNIPTALNAITKAEVGLKRAQDLLATQQLTLKRIDAQLEEARSTGKKTTAELALLEEKRAIIMQKLSTATEDLAAKQEDLNLKNDAYIDTLKLFATSVGTTILTAFTSVTIILTQQATQANLTTGAYIRLKLQMLSASLAQRGFTLSTIASTFSLTGLRAAMTAVSTHPLMTIALVTAAAAMAAYETNVLGLRDALSSLAGTELPTISGLMTNLTGTVLPEAQGGVEDTTKAIDQATLATEQFNDTLSPGSTNALGEFSGALTEVSSPGGPLNEFALAIGNAITKGSEFAQIYAKDGTTAILTAGKNVKIFTDEVNDASEAIDNLKKNLDKVEHKIIVNPELAQYITDPFNTNPQVAAFLKFLAEKNRRKVPQVAGLKVFGSGVSIPSTTQFAGRSLKRAAGRSAKFGGSNVTLKNKLNREFEKISNRFESISGMSLNQLSSITGLQLRHGLLHGMGGRNALRQTTFTNYDAYVEAQASAASQADAERQRVMNNIAEVELRIALADELFSLDPAQYGSFESLLRTDSHVLQHQLAVENQEITQISNLTNLSSSQITQMRQTEQGRSDIAGISLYMQRTQKEMLVSSTV